MTAEHAHGIDAGGEVEHAESLLDCQCGHSMDEHNGLGCYARITYTPLVKCECLLTDDRTYADLLAPRLADHDATTRATAADTVLAEAHRICCGDNPAPHHAATDTHSTRMAFAEELARAVRGS